MVIAIVYLILVLNDYQIWWNKEIIMCSYVLMFHVSDLHYHDSTSICFACLGFHSKWEHTISWALMQMPDSLLMAAVQENIYRARSIHCLQTHWIQESSSLAVCVIWISTCWVQEVAFRSKEWHSKSQNSKDKLQDRCHAPQHNCTVIFYIWFRSP